MTQIDVNTFVGSYPFRDLGGNDDADLLRAIARVGTDVAWVSHLAAMYWRDPMAGNPALIALQQRHHQLRAVPAIHPGLPGWQEELAGVRDLGVPAVRVDPGCYGLSADGSDMRTLVAATADAGLPILMAVRMEDLRQRHPNDKAPDLTAAAVRHLIRSDPRARLIVTHADRDFIEQVHFGSTLAEAQRLLWDMSWIWGPPEDHLALLLETVGAGRFTFGTGTPMRLAETTLARLDLLNPDPAMRQALLSGNLVDFLSR